MIFSVLLSINLHAFAQERFSGERAFGYIQELCRPEYQGRRTGTIAARRAAEWIAQQFQSYGFQPAGDDGTFIQAFPMLVTQQTQKSQLRLLNGSFGRIEYIEGVDFTIYLNSGSGNYTTDVVFVGYGISEPNLGRDDYAGVDVRGKIVLLYRDLPQDGRDWEFANERDYKVAVASAHGAVALLMLEKGDWPTRGGTIHEQGYRRNFIAYNISRKVARDLFTGTFKSLDNTLRDLGKAPQSFPLNKKMHINAKVKPIKDGKGENVVAVLPGSDPELRSQYIIVGGHMDHTGMDHHGHIYHGADDNASGTAIVMELARIFTSRPERPRRSILFVAFGAEEQGLCGSKYFACHPPFPARNIVAMLNFDMEGMGDGGVGISGVNYFPDILPSLTSLWSDSLRKKTRLGRGWGMGGSDHAHFIEQGIPAIGFYSTGGHPFYHQFEDVPALINVTSLQSVGDRAAEILSLLANTAEPSTYLNEREGYFFLQHGDQVDWNEAYDASDILSAEFQNRMTEKSRDAVRMVILNLVWPKSMSCADTLFEQINHIERILKTSNIWLRYANSASLDRAAAEQKVAVAVGLQENTLFDHPLTYFSALARLGLNFLRIKEGQYLFSPDGKVNDKGNDILKTCSKHAIILDCNFTDTVLVQLILDNYDGKFCWRVPLAQSERLLSFAKKNLHGNHRLWVIQCREADSVEVLSRMIDAQGVSNIHVDLSLFDEEATLSRAQWLQSFYRLRRQEVGIAHAYKEMEQIMGRNLKMMLAN